MHAIAVHLIKGGVPTPWEWRGKGAQRARAMGGWHVVSARGILTNETYIGTLYYGKKQRMPGKSNPDKKTRWRDVPREEWIPIPVPPIIDPATFHAAQAQIQRNAQQSRRNRKYEYLFVAGRLRCGQCGRSMSGYSTGHGVRAYRCSHHPYQTYATPHRPRSCPALPLEDAVWHVVEQALHNPVLIATELDRRREGTSTQQTDLDRERQQYSRQIAQCEKDLKRWEAAYLGEAIDLADFKAKKAEIDTRRAGVEQEIARLDAQQRLIEQVQLETASLMDYCARVRQQLQHFDLAEKRLALEALNITVAWHPENPLTIQGSIPVDIEDNAPWCT